VSRRALLTRPVHLLDELRRPYYCGHREPADTAQFRHTCGNRGNRIS
jgi:hypothetical protein